MLYGEVNSEVTDSISILDRGFNYGDGIFTTGQITQGCIELLDLHLERLSKSCHLLHITPPNLTLLESRLLTLAKDYSYGVIKVLITAGTGGRGYARKADVTPNIVISIYEYPEHYNTWKIKGVILGKSRIELGINPMLAGLKHLNRLEQVLIRNELSQTPYDDILVFNLNKQLIESSSANIFWFKNNVLYTPEVTLSGVAGLMRQHIINHHAEVRIVTADENDFLQADAAFICNSVMGVIPIKQYLTKSYDIQAVHAFTQHMAGLTGA